MKTSRRSFVRSASAIGALAVSLIFISVFTTAQATPLTLEDVNSLKHVATARMNPAGDRIAYLLQVPRKIYVDDDGKPYHELHVTDLQGNSLPFISGDIDITDIAWAADGESIFFLAQRDEEAEFNSLHEFRVCLDHAEIIRGCHVGSSFSLFPAFDSEPCGEPTALINRTLGIELCCDVSTTNDVRRNTSSLQRFLQFA